MNANLKKIAAVLLCLCLLVGLGACRKNEEPSPDAIDQIEGIIGGPGKKRVLRWLRKNCRRSSTRRWKA